MGRRLLLVGVGISELKNVLVLLFTATVFPSRGAILDTALD